MCLILHFLTQNLMKFPPNDNSLLFSFAFPWLLVRLSIFHIFISHLYFFLVLPFLVFALFFFFLVFPFSCLLFSSIPYRLSKLRNLMFSKERELGKSWTTLPEIHTTYILWYARSKQGTVLNKPSRSSESLWFYWGDEWISSYEGRGPVLQCRICRVQWLQEQALTKEC